MRLSDASVVIRPRTTWEAMDLGVLMSQRHRHLLMTSWAIVTLPTFALLSLLLWDSPSLAVFIFWWLKPAFERLPLYILSKTLFGETPTLKQALRQWPQLLKPQLLASLTWRRLSPNRSFVMPVVQLEGLSGMARQQRLHVLLQRNAGAAQWLTIIGVHLESALWIGLMVLFYLLLPQQIELDWNWQTLIAAVNHDWLWLEHLTNAFYALVLVAWEPVYVACGFSLYLNRRTVLEAWDIELVFRRMRQRLSGAAVVLLLAVIACIPTAQTVWAAEPVISPDSPRLLDQPLTSQASGTASRRSLISRRSRTRKPLPDIVLAKTSPPQNPVRWQRPRMAEDAAQAAGQSTFQRTGHIDRSGVVGRGDCGRRAVDLALPRVVAGVCQPSTGPSSKARSPGAQAVIRAGRLSPNPAGRRCRECRNPLADQPSGGPRAAVSRPAQPLVA